MCLYEIDNYVIITSLNSETTCKLINRLPGSRLLISSLPGSASRTHGELLGKPRDSTGILKALPGKLRKPRESTNVLEDLPCKLDIKRHSLSILYLLDTGLYKIDCAHLNTIL